MALFAARTGSHPDLSATIQKLDQRALTWVADTDHGPLRPLLTIGARGADLLVPWIAVSLRLLSRRDAASRTVRRAWAGMALAAFMENGLLKPVFHRSRPDPGRLPSRERRSNDPSTSSFPSGHTGAATAFAVVVGHEVPRLRLPVITMAVGVAYTHFYSGRHYLSDALIGGAVGAAAGVFINVVSAYPRVDDPTPGM